jgi:AcrR family transcriptional regulator
LSAASDALLDRCLQVLRRRSFSRLSLREIAAAAGTSHRMLIYHFGSREGLLAQVVARIEADTRVLLAGLAAEGPIFEVAREFWARITTPEMLPAQRLFFEIYVQALYGQAWTATFRESVITAWEGPLVALYARAGVADPVAHARLGLAVTRGLGLDLLLTGERDHVEQALDLFATMVQRDLPPPSPTPPSPSSSPSRSAERTTVQ